VITALIEGRRPLASPPTQEVNGEIRHDAIEPGEEGRCAVKSVQMLMNSNKSLLCQIHGVISVPDHAIGNTEDSFLVADDERLEGLFVPCLTA
jgi:hypothetical protein